MEGKGKRKVQLLSFFLKKNWFLLPSTGDHFLFNFVAPSKCSSLLWWRWHRSYRCCCKVSLSTLQRIKSSLLTQSSSCGKRWKKVRRISCRERIMISWYFPAVSKKKTPEVHVFFYSSDMKLQSTRRKIACCRISAALNHQNPVRISHGLYWFFLFVTDVDYKNLWKQ